MSNHIGRKGQRFFFIDFETTGLNPGTDFPIEIGIVVTDEWFNVVETYTRLIDWIEYRYRVPEESLPAYRVHGILPNNILEEGKHNTTVRAEVEELAGRHRSKQGDLPVLVSDNLQFEWQFLNKLLEGSITKLFHYCGWDTSLLLEAAGVGDPKPVHRALADAGLIHAAVVRACERINMFGRKP